MIPASDLTLAFLPFGGGIGTTEMIIIGAVAVLLFGKRLPEVGRSLGKSLVEFKKGMQGIEDELRGTATPAARPKRHYELEDQRDEPTAPKFEPPSAT